MILSKLFYKNWQLKSKKNWTFATVNRI